jgi:UDP-glucose 4-epimerase
VREVLTAIERVSGRKVPYRIAPRRPGDPAVLIGSAQKAITELGWRPSFAQLERIVETAWRFHLSRLPAES